MKKTAAHGASRPPANDFRGKFLDGLKRLHRQRKLQLADKLLPLFEAPNFAAWLNPLCQKDWVVYIQPPLSPGQCPEAG